MRAPEVNKRSELAASLHGQWKENTGLMDRISAANQYLELPLREEALYELLASHNIVIAVLVYLLDGSDVLKDAPSVDGEGRRSWPSSAKELWDR